MKENLLKKITLRGLQEGLLVLTEMQKAADAADIPVLIFSAGANFWAILGNFWANLGNFG